MKSTVIYEIIPDEPDPISGLPAFSVRGRRMSRGKIAEECILRGLFTDLKQAQGFAAYLQENAISPCHMEDIAEDVL